MYEKINTNKAEQDSKIKVIAEMSTADMTSIKEQIQLAATLKGKVDKLKRELRGRRTPMMVYPTTMGGKFRYTFAGNKNDNLIEFLKNCERAMECIGTDRLTKNRFHYQMYERFSSSVVYDHT